MTDLPQLTIDTQVSPDDQQTQRFRLDQTEMFDWFHQLPKDGVSAGARTPSVTWAAALGIRFSRFSSRRDIPPGPNPLRKALYRPTSERAGRSCRCTLQVNRCSVITRRCRLFNKRTNRHLCKFYLCKFLQKKIQLEEIGKIWISNSILDEIHTLTYRSTLLN